MIKRAACAKDLGMPIVMHDYLTAGFTANTSLAAYCRDEGLLLGLRRQKINVKRDLLQGKRGLLSADF